MEERAVYNSEDGKWYRQGKILRPLVFAVADTSLDAHEKLFGRSLFIPPPTRVIVGVSPWYGRD